MQRGFVCCPYNSSHTMPRERLQWHLAKCADKARNEHQFATCPFNSTHIVVKTELSYHIAHCKDKVLQHAENERDELDLEMKRYAQDLSCATRPNSGPREEWQIEDEDLPVGVHVEKKGPSQTQKRNMKRREARKRKTELQKSLECDITSTDPKVELTQALKTQPSQKESNLATASNEDGWTTVPRKRNGRSTSDTRRPSANDNRKNTTATATTTKKKATESKGSHAGRGGVGRT